MGPNGRSAFVLEGEQLNIYAAQAGPTFALQRFGKRAGKKAGPATQPGAIGFALTAGNWTNWGKRGLGRPRNSLWRVRFLEISGSAKQERPVSELHDRTFACQANLTQLGFWARDTRFRLEEPFAWCKLTTSEKIAKTPSKVQTASIHGPTATFGRGSAHRKRSNRRREFLPRWKLGQEPAKMEKTSWPASI